MWKGNGWYKHAGKGMDRIDHYYRSDGQTTVSTLCRVLPGSPLEKKVAIKFLRCKVCKKVLKSIKAREKSIRRFSDKGADWL